MEAGIDPVTQAIPVVPAAHYHMGGILTDADGRSSIDGLWACGEVTSTGAHGANRLASNSLLEAVVFAGRIAADIAGLLPGPKTNPWTDRSGEREAVEPAGDSEAMKLLRKTMSKHVGVIRNGPGLREALKTIVSLEASNRSPRFANALATARLMAAMALQREESRGGHYREDFPHESPEWRRRTFTTLEEADAIAREAAERQAA
jgi:L-aspartate oxidase